MADFNPFEKKMQAAGMDEAAIRAFHHAYTFHLSGVPALTPESTIEPVSTLPRSSTLHKATASESIAATVVIKLNGGLGTGMGLEKAKSLLEVKDGQTFLDLIARQILHQRKSAPGLRFLLMNSFSTSDDTRKFLSRYPQLGRPDDLEFLQNKVPKVLVEDDTPLSWPENRSLEWCPPGHGDIYASLMGSGLLDSLIEDGIQYAFVSNSDNLGATLDPAILEWFIKSGAPFAMEVTARTEADRKGGHLAVRKSDGRFILRESVQCPKEDASAFQDITRHRFFNTNNLWLRLDRLKQALDEAGGLLPLPVMRNFKPADPRDASSPQVVQLETAMGAAIECFPDSAAIVVPRKRFSPVKTTSDLLVLRSDACMITPDCRIELLEQCAGVPPIVQLDAKYYKSVDELEACFGSSAPSLRDCTSLTVNGPVKISHETVFQGIVELHHLGDQMVTLPTRLYQDEAIEFVAEKH